MDGETIFNFPIDIRWLWVRP